MYRKRRRNKEELALAWIIISIASIISIIVFPPIVLIAIVIYAIWTLSRHYYFQSIFSPFLAISAMYFQTKVFLFLEWFLDLVTTRRRIGVVCSTFTFGPFRPFGNPYQFQTRIQAFQEYKCVVWSKEWIKSPFYRYTLFLGGICSLSQHQVGPATRNYFQSIIRAFRVIYFQAEWSLFLVQYLDLLLDQMPFIFSICFRPNTSRPGGQERRFYFQSNIMYFQMRMYICVYIYSYFQTDMLCIFSLIYSLGILFLGQYPHFQCRSIRFSSYTE